MDFKDVSYSNEEEEEEEDFDDGVHLLRVVKMRFLREEKQFLCVFRGEEQTSEFCEWRTLAELENFGEAALKLCRSFEQNEKWGKRGKNFGTKPKERSEESSVVCDEKAAVGGGDEKVDEKKSLGRKVVLVYSGTFNPVHRGHVDVATRARTFVEKTLQCRIVAAVVVPSHHRSVVRKVGARQALTNEHRVAMLNLAFKDTGFVINDWLMKQDKNEGMRNAVLHIREQIREKDAEFFTICGADALPVLKSCYENKQSVVCVLNRAATFDVNEFAKAKAKDFGAKVHLVEADIIEVSSTKVRANFNVEGKNALPEPVFDYHVEKGITYVDGIVLSKTAVANENEMKFILQRVTSSVLFRENVEWKAGDILGSGACATVSSGNDGDRRVAVKSVDLLVKKRNVRLRSSAVENELNCAETLRKSCLDLAHICCTEAVFLEDSNILRPKIGLMMPLFDSSVWLHVQRCAEARADDAFVCTIMRHVALGMRTLHAANFYHRDLNTRNVLLRFDGQSQRVACAVVADFGLTLSRKTSLSGYLRGSLAHYAPEAVADKGFYSFACDAFMWALLAPVMCSGQELWETFGSTEAAIQKNALGERPKMRRLPKLMPLIERAWDVDPSKRPTFEDMTTTTKEME